MKIDNVDVIQSYLLTTARYDFNVYEKRILYRLVELCQPSLKGQKLNDRFSINPDLFGMTEIKIPIRYLLSNEEDHNHTRIKDAVTSLRNKTFEYEDDKIWKLIGIIETPIVDKGNEFIEFKIHPEIYTAILDFSKGFRKFELKTAMSFDTIYAMRFYELFSGKTNPITYSIRDLKIMFRIENRYKLFADFRRYVIDTAKKELDKKAPYSFEYKVNKDGRKSVSITFYPVLIPENRDEELEKRALQKRLSPSWELDKMIIDYLKQNFAFSSKEISYNIDLLKDAQTKLDLMFFLSSLKRKALEKAKPKGYVIGAIKREIKKNK